MESRRLYREIEEAANTGRYSQDEYPHTYISRYLRHTYRSSRDYRETLSVSLMALSSIVGRPDIKFDSAKELNHDLFDKYLDGIPYIAAEHAKTVSERESAVALFNEAKSDLSDIGRRLEELQKKKTNGRDPNKIDI